MQPAGRNAFDRISHFPRGCRQIGRGSLPITHCPLQLKLPDRARECRLPADGFDVSSAVDANLFVAPAICSCIDRCIRREGCRSGSCRDGRRDVISRELARSRTLRRHKATERIVVMEKSRLLIFVHLASRLYILCRGINRKTAWNWYNVDAETQSDLCGDLYCIFMISSFNSYGKGYTRRASCIVCRLILAQFRATLAKRNAHQRFRMIFEKRTEFAPLKYLARRDRKTPRYSNERTRVFHWTTSAFPWIANEGVDWIETHHSLSAAIRAGRAHQLSLAASLATGANLSSIAIDIVTDRRYRV